MAKKRYDVYDECWNCGTQLTAGDLFIEVTLNRVDPDCVGTDQTDEDVYHRSCLKCALTNVIGVNIDTLDTCAPKDYKDQIK